MIRSERAKPGISTKGKIAAPAGESRGSCKKPENNATAHTKAKIDVSARTPRLILNGSPAFTTPARLINPTDRYIKREL